MTNVPDMKLITSDGVRHHFNEIYEFHMFLGTGSFGFVISATHKETGDLVAMKVSFYFVILMLLKIVDASQQTSHSLIKEAEILQGLP